MIYDVDVCIIDPRTYKVTRQSCMISLDYAPDYEDMVHEFFRNWDRKDKYDICYAIGIESMRLHDN